MARVFSGVCSLVFVAAASATVLAQDAWPSYPLRGHDLPRGPGGYLSPVKMLALVATYFAWVKTTDWINRDAQILKLNFSLWNPVNFFPFLVVFLLIALSIPFPIGYGLLVVSWLAPLGAYIFQRNASVEMHQKVLTPSHLRHLAALTGSKLGMKIDTEKKAAYQKGAPVDFEPLGGDPSKNQANLILARNSDGFVPAKELVADAVDRRGDKLMLDLDAEQMAVRYQIDGVWHEADPRDPETADPIVAVYKRLAGADPEQRRQRQSGDFSVAYKDHKYTAHLVAQGTKTGERAIVHLFRDGLAFDSLPAAGMREKMLEQLKQVLDAKNGVFLFCSIPSGGLSTTVALTEKMCDRYMRDFVAFQDVHNAEPVAENVEVANYDPKQDKVRDKLQTVFRKDPDVVIVHDLVDKEVTEFVCTQAGGEKLVLATIRAKEAVEALLRVLLLKVPAKLFAPVAVGVLNQRLIRKLCEDCKEEYTPSADLLKKLGIPAGRVESLYRPHQTEEDQPPCATCGGLGYVGRTSIFELLVVNDKIREALIKQPKLEVLRDVARKSGHRTLQEEGVGLVAKGVTSLAELTRVLKQ